MGSNQTDQVTDTRLCAAIKQLESRVFHLGRNQTSPAAKIMARGVLTSATRVALLLGVDLDTAGPTINAAAESPLLQEINELQLEMDHPVVATGNRGFMNFWPRRRA